MLVPGGDRLRQLHDLRMRPRAVGLHELLHRLARMTVEEIRALPSMHPGRADVITGGALIEARIAARMKVGNLIVSESDILDGIALQLIHR